MKLCDLIQAYTPTSGGIRTYITEKRRYIQHHTDWDHCFLYPAEEDTLEQHGRFSTCTIASPFIPGCEPYRIALSIDRAVEFLKQESPDIIELGSGYVLPWAAFRYRKRFNPDVRITGFYHTDYPTAYVQPFVSRYLGAPSGLLAKRLASRYARHVYNQCNAMIAPSPLLKKTLVCYGIRNVSTIPLGVDLDAYNPSNRDNSLRVSLHIGDQQLMLVYVGRLDSEKNVLMLAESLRFLPDGIDPVLVLVGDGPQREDLEAFEPDRGRIIVHPYTTDKEYLARLLASADIYVTAGAFETFGLSIVEAQASGLPVAGVDSGALKDRVTPQTGILGPVDDPAGMAAGIANIAENGAREMGRAARELAESRYSWKSTFDQLFGRYHSLLTPAKT